MQIRSAYSVKERIRRSRANGVVRFKKKIYL